MKKKKTRKPRLKENSEGNKICMDLDMIDGHEQRYNQTMIEKVTRLRFGFCLDRWTLSEILYVVKTTNSWTKTQTEDGG